MPTHDSSAQSRWLSLQVQLGQRLSGRLFQEVAKQPLNPAEGRALTPSWSLRLALLLAGLVYAASFTIGLAGVAILLRPWSNLFVIALGIALVLLSWITRPRPVEAPYYIVSRSDYPTLYALSERIAHAMGAPPLEGIAVSAEFSANYRVAGWRMRRYVELGAPLLAVLSVKERIALIAHELSHGANGDPLRGHFLFGAVNTLSAWAMTVRPMSIGNAGAGLSFGPFISLIAIPLELLLLATSELLFLFVKGVLLLVLRQSQRAEYLADRLAATVSGTTEMQSTLEKTYLVEVVNAALRTHALTCPDKPIGPMLAETARSLTAADLEAQRAESRASNWQVDSTHPPTALRVDMLARATSSPPMALLSPAELDAVEAEFDRLIASTHREIINRKLEAIYG